MNHAPKIWSVGVSPDRLHLDHVESISDVEALPQRLSEGAPPAVVLLAVSDPLQSNALESLVNQVLTALPPSTALLALFPDGTGWGAEALERVVLAGADGAAGLDQPKLLQSLVSRCLNRSKAPFRDAEATAADLLTMEIKAVERHTMILHVSDSEQIVEASQRYCEVTGYGREELIGQDCWDAIDENCSPLDRELIRRTLQAGEVFECEVAAFRKDGSRYWMTMVMVPHLSASGEFLHCVAICTDVSRRHETQATLNHMVEAVRHSPDGIAITDRQGFITYTNPAFAEVLGYAEDELVGRAADQLLAPETAGDLPLSPWVAQTSQDDEVLRRLPVVVHKDGHRLALQETIVPLRDEGGETSGYVVTVRDVTTERLAEQQLYEAQKMESLGTLADGLAHDFKNILNPIFGYVDLLETKLEPESREATWLKRIRSAGDRARELVERILSFSQRGGIERIKIDLARVCAETAPLLQSGLTRHIPLETSFEREGTMVLGDSDQIRQVLLALGANASYALKHHRGDPRIRLRVRPVEVDRNKASTVSGLRAGSYVLLELEDNGEGIDPSKLPRIFDPYFTTKPMDEGSGMGLPAVQGIVRSHGGALAVHSEQGKGTRMELYFPAAEPNASVAPQDAAAGIDTV